MAEAQHSRRSPGRQTSGSKMVKPPRTAVSPIAKLARERERLRPIVQRLQDELRIAEKKRLPAMPRTLLISVETSVDIAPFIAQRVHPESKPGGLHRYTTDAAAIRRGVRAAIRYLKGRGHTDDRKDTGNHDSRIAWVVDDGEEGAGDEPEYDADRAS